MLSSIVVDERIRRYLTDVFMRSSSPVILNAASFYERPLAIDGEKGRGEVYEAVLSSRLFRISIKEATIHASAISKGKKYGEYLIDGRRCPPFGMEEILSILSSSGYKVLPSMKRDLEHILPVNNFQFSRDKDGMLGFYRGLCDLDLGNFNLTFEYKRRGEGEFALYSSFSEKEVDIGDLEALNLGIRTYGEVDERRRLKLIDYLKRLSFMLGEGSYDLFDLVDYYRIIDMMQTSDEDKDFSFTIVKRKVMRRDDGYVRTLTPFDFQYYRDGFTDSEEEREIFLGYFDKFSADDDGKEDCKEKLVKAYATLGLPADAGREEVKDAYRRLLMRFHPDTISSLGLDEEFLKFANEKVRLINEAYKTIMEDL